MTSIGALRDMQAEFKRLMHGKPEQYKAKFMQEVSNDLAKDLQDAINMEIVDQVRRTADDNLLAMVIDERQAEILTEDMTALMKRCFHEPLDEKPDSNAIAIADHILHEVREGVISTRQIVMRLIDRTSETQPQVVARSFSHVMAEACPIKVTFRKPISEYAVKTFMESYGVPGVMGLYWTMKDRSSHVYFSDAASATLGSGYFAAL